MTSLLSCSPIPKIVLCHPPPTQTNTRTCFLLYLPTPMFSLTLLASLNTSNIHQPHRSDDGKHYEAPTIPVILKILAEYTFESWRTCQMHHSPISQENWTTWRKQGCYWRVLAHAKSASQCKWPTRTYTILQHEELLANSCTSINTWQDPIFLLQGRVLQILSPTSKDNKVPPLLPENLKRQRMKRATHNRAHEETNRSYQNVNISETLSHPV